ncbi:MAG: RagB/SusD family nutrient uptake outer membrane protein [Bacteroidota bacterium]
MKIKFLTAITLLSMTFAFSCNDWMELLPPQGLTREEFWQTKEDVRAVVMGAYETFASMDERLFQLGEMRADMIKYDVNLGSSEKRVMEGNIYPDNYLCDWATFYKVINYCNEVIKNAPLVQDIDDTFTDYQMQGFLSEAYFLRSLAYFYLVRIYKDVPYITEPTESDDADVYPVKTDGDEILQNVLTDLEDYRKYATVDGYQTLAENKGRATKAAIDALMADIALWQFDYNAVLTYVARIEANPDYEIMTPGTWFEIFYPGNSLESIFEFQFNDALNQANSLYGLTQRYAYNYDPSQTALELFAKEYAKESTLETVRGEGASIKKYAENDYIIWKYVGRASDNLTTRTGTEQNSANWIVYRLSDVMLMKAEALAMLERYPEALAIMNGLRSERSMAPLTIANNPNDYEDKILEERARELAFEGKRWFDLLRMGRRNDYARKTKLIDIIITNVPSTQKRILATKLTNSLGWYMPIYKSEIERNKNLVQNPYYNF